MSSQGTKIKILETRVNWLSTALAKSKLDNERQQRELADRDEQIRQLEAALDDATRTAENAYEKLERIGYCGYGTDEREFTHRASAILAAKRQEQGEEVEQRRAKKHS